MLPVTDVIIERIKHLTTRVQKSSEGYVSKLKDQVSEAGGAGWQGRVTDNKG